MEKTLQELSWKIVELSRRAFRQGLVSGTSGNLSCRVATGMLITPTSARYETMGWEDIVLLELDGTVGGRGGRPSSEWRLHAAIYQAYPQVNAVFHTHSPYATAFAVNHENIPAVLIESHVFLGGDVRCAEYATPGSCEVGVNAVSALEGRGGCTLANHGVVAVGKDLEEAYLRAEYIEDTAKIYAMAKAVGTPIPLPKL